MHNYQYYKKMTEEALEERLPRIDRRCETLKKAMTYSLEAGGKRLRPVLCLAACEFCGQDPSFALAFACAIEYIQTYSLIHDDLPAMDDDDLRRGKPTNHKVFGEGIAILAGDGLLSAAYETMAEDMMESLTQPDQLRRKTLALREIAKGTGCRGMVAGQVCDLEAENGGFGEDMLLFIHRNKTAAFFYASVLAGAHLGADPEKLEALITYARNMGMAFQVVDDVMDIKGDADKRGKAVGGDAEAGKLTYPSVYGLEESEKIARDYIDKAAKAMERYGEEAAVFNEILDMLRVQIDG